MHSGAGADGLSKGAPTLKVSAWGKLEPALFKCINGCFVLSVTERAARRVFIRAPVRWVRCSGWDRRAHGALQAGWVPENAAAGTS